MSHGSRLLGVLTALFLAVAPAGAGADYYEAQSYFRQGKFQKTLEVLDAIKNPPPELLLMRADCLIGLERDPEALKTLQELVRRYPRLEFGQAARTKELRLLDRMHDWKGLVEALEEALQLDSSGDSPFVKELALAHVKAGHTDKAVEVLLRYPTTQNLDLLAEILKDANSLTAFLADRERTASRDPTSARILGTLFSAAQNWQKAKKYLEMAPSTLETLELRLEVAKALRDSEAEIALYELLIAKAPSRGSYYEKLGELYLARGDAPKAKATWRKLVSTQTPSPDNYTWLSRVLLDHGFKEEALQVLQEGRLALGDPNLFRKEAAECFTAMGQFESACQEYLELAAVSFETVKEPLVALASSSDAAFKACASALLRAIQARPGMPEYYFLADEVLRLHGFDDQTRKVVDSMCTAFRSVPRELLSFAGEFEVAGKNEEALSLVDCEVRQARGMELSDGLLVQASLLRRMGRAAESLAALARLSASGAGPGYVQRGEAMRGDILLDDLHRYVEARSVFESLVTRYPTAPQKAVWQLAIARASFGANDLAAAGTLLDSLQESPRAEVRQGARYLRGWLEQLQGKFDGAMSDFSAITMEDTGSRFASDALAAMLFLTTHPLSKEEQPYMTAYFRLQHDFEEGHMDRYVADAAGVDPAKIPESLKADFLFLQGQVQHKQGANEPAAKSWEYLLEKYADSPHAPEAMLALADLYEHDMKDAAKAAKILKDYLLANPASLELDELRGRIQRLEAPKS